MANIALSILFDRDSYHRSNWCKIKHSSIFHACLWIDYKRLVQLMFTKAYWQWKVLLQLTWLKSASANAWKRPHGILSLTGTCLQQRNPSGYRSPKPTACGLDLRSKKRSMTRTTFAYYYMYTKLTWLVSSMLYCIVQKLPSVEKISSISFKDERQTANLMQWQRMQWSLLQYTLYMGNSFSSCIQKTWSWAHLVWLPQEHTETHRTWHSHQ